MYSEEYYKARKEFLNCLFISIFSLGFSLINAFKIWLPIMREEKKKGIVNSGK